MAFDGIVTRAVTKELKNIVNYKIDKVYEPDKNTVVLFENDLPDNYAG